MNQNPEKFGRGLLEVDFEFGLDVVNAGERQIIGHGAVAGNVEPAADLLDLDVVHVDNLGKPRSEGFQAAFEGGIAHRFVASLDGGGFTFDMGEDVTDLAHVAAHVGFELGDLIVSAFERHAFVELDVLLDMQLAGEILHADVVDVEVVARRDGANAVEDIFRQAVRNAGR